MNENLFPILIMIIFLIVYFFPMDLKRKKLQVKVYRLLCEWFNYHHPLSTNSKMWNLTGFTFRCVYCGKFTQHTKDLKPKKEL